MRLRPTPDWQKKYDFSRRVVDHAGELLAKPAVIEALGAKAAILDLVAGLAVALPVSNGEVGTEGMNDLSAIPVVALSSGEKAIIAETSASPLQQYCATKAYGQKIASDFLVAKNTTDELVMPGDVFGVCRARVATYPSVDPADEPRMLYSRGRPMIGLHYKRRHDVNYRALTLIHELDHAANKILFPFQFAANDDDYYLESELSAYAVQSAVGNAVGLKDPRYAPHRIEQIRQEFNGDVTANEAFMPRPELRERLAAVGLGKIHLS